MIDFNSLLSHEQALAMLLAYFEGYSENKANILKLGAKLMPAELASNAFKELSLKGLLNEKKSYKHKEAIEYSLHHKLLFPAIFELFEPQNHTLLKNIRSLFKQEHVVNKPKRVVCELIGIIDHIEFPEAVHTHLNINHPLFKDIFELIDQAKYKKVFDKMPQDIFNTSVRNKLQFAFYEDKDINWEYLKELILSRNSNKTYTNIYTSVLDVFAFFYFLATGNVCTDLNTTTTNLLTLQIIAIQELYRGNYEKAYKLYVKIMTINNKSSLEKGVFYYPISNYYYVLTMLLTNTPEALKKIASLSKCKSASINYISCLNSCYFLVAPFKQFFCDKVDITMREQFLLECYNRNSAIFKLSKMIYQRLGTLTENKKNVSEEPRWAYLRNEMQVAKNSEEAAELERKFGGKSLFHSLKFTEPWKMRLESLIQSNISATTADKDMSENMLIYLLRYSTIVPILKRKLKNGNWSVGKELSISKLKALDIAELDKTDHKLITEICAWDYSLGINDYLHLLTGCDHVYIMLNNTMQPVSIHEEKPCLIIDKTKNGTFNVSSNIEPILERNGIIQYTKKNSETDYSIIIPSAFELKTYKEILLQKEYPVEAEPLLVKLITMLGGKTEIHSNMVEELNNIDHIDIPPVITLCITPNNINAFNISAIVRATDTLIFSPGHGNITTIAEKDGKKVQLVRSLKKEKNNLKQISEGLIEAEVCDEDDEWLPTTINDSITLSIEQMLPFMQWCKNNPNICTMEWPEGYKLNYYPSINSSSANISFTKKGGWFEIEGNVQISDGQVVSLQKLLELMRQSNKQKYIRIGDNEYITLSSQLTRILKRLDTVSSENRSHLQMAPSAVSILGEVFNDKSLNLKSNSAINELRQRIEESSKTTPCIPKTLQAQLRDYQEEGFEWMSKVTAWGAGVCLADDMGLGKTLQTITLLLEQSKEGASLVIAPASVVPNWRNELKRFSPTLNVIVLNQSDDRSKAIKDAQSGDVVIATYALLNTQQEELTKREWNVVCLDEAHTIKNANTKMSKAAMFLQARRKVILTGTPIQNHLAELWNLFQFINPGLLGSAEQFKRKFIQPIAGNNDKERQSQLRRLISPFLLRRTKSEVIEELPTKNDIYIPVELSSDEMTMYEVRRRQVEAAVLADKSLNVSTLSEITRLRQMACSCSLVDSNWKIPGSKLLTFLDLAEGLNDSGNRALVFSQFTSYLDEVRKAMEKAKLPFLYLDGSTPMTKREQLVKDFQTGKCPFFLISLKAGGLGLNLTGANYVIHLDPWWNPAIEQQATDRAYRIGQQQDVTVYHLISQHTIEEKILRLHKTKRNLADSLLEGADMAHVITQEEMLNLLKEN